MLGNVVKSLFESVYQPKRAADGTFAKVVGDGLVDIPIRQLPQDNGLGSHG